MQPIDEILRYGTDVPKFTPSVLLAIAIACAIGIVGMAWWIKVAPGEPGMEVLGPPIAALMALGGLYVGGSWHLVELNARTRLVSSSHGFLHWRLGWLSRDYAFEQISGVRVKRVIDEETSQDMAGKERKRYVRRFELLLLTGQTRVQVNDQALSATNHPLVLPETKGADLAQAEALAQRVARLGGWALQVDPPSTENP